MKAKNPAQHVTEESQFTVKRNRKARWGEPAPRQREGREIGRFSPTSWPLRTTPIYLLGLTCLVLHRVPWACALKWIPVYITFLCPRLWFCPKVPAEKIKSLCRLWAAGNTLPGYGDRGAFGAKFNGCFQISHLKGGARSWFSSSKLSVPS